MAAKDVKTPAKPAAKPAPRSPSGARLDDAPSPLSIAGIRTKTQSLGVKIVMGMMIFIFAAAFIIPALNGGGVPQGAAPGRAPGAIGPPLIAQVGNETVERENFSNALAQQIDINTKYLGNPADATNFLRTEQQVLDNLAGSAATVDAARKAGIVVSGEEIDAEIDKQINEGFKPQGGQSEAAFRRQIEQEFGSMDAAKTKMHERAAGQRDAIERKLLADKLEKQVKDANKVTEDDYKRSVTKLKLWQIVLRPKMPAGNVKDFKAEQEKNAAALAPRAARIFAALKADPTLQNFKMTAAKESDDEASKQKSGDFGWKMPAEIYQPTGAGDMLAKSPQNLVGPLKDEGGNQYIFFIESRKTEFPKDYAKNKAKLFKDFETQKDDEAWRKRQEAIKKAAPPQINDPALAAFQLQNEKLVMATGETQKQVRQQVIEGYETALDGGPNGLEAAAINFQLASLYRDAGQKDKQLAALEAAAKVRGEDANVRLELARALREAGKSKEAVAQLKEASRAVDSTPPAQPSPFGGAGSDPGTALRGQIATEFAFNKEPKLAAAERGKIKPPSPSPMGGGGIPGMPGVHVMPQAR